jgi:hypothetical protein
MVDGLESLTIRELNRSAICQWTVVRVSVSRDEYVNIHLPSYGVQRV